MGYYIIVFYRLSYHIRWVCILTTYFFWVKRMILSVIKHVILNGNPHQLDVSQGTDGSGKERLGRAKCYNL